VSDESKYGKQFIDNYLQVLGAVWHTDGEEAKLLADPTAYAIEKGLPVTPGAVVKLDRSQPEGLFQTDEILRDWTAAPGEHILHIPVEELISETDLTEDELESVAGGGDINVIIACVAG
jgi:hypothetical protein